MTDPPTAPPSSTAVENDDARVGAVRLPRWVQMTGLIAGVAMIVAAIVVVMRQGDAATDAWRAISSPSIGHLILLIVAVPVNIVLTAALFSVLIARYGKVRIIEMQALIASATLLNFLPLRPGLFGRVAYHKMVNNIRARDSAKTIVQAMGVSIGVACALALCIVVSRVMTIPLWTAALAPIIGLTVGLGVASVRIWALAGLIRYIEVGVWATRYYAAFELIGRPIGVDAAVAFACISTVATLIPFVSNGLGVREWAIGLTAPLLTANKLQLGMGITADLVNRAVELVVITILGLISLAYLAQIRKRLTALRES